MTSGMPELGSKISLISKADIRYEGRLYTVDPNECTIALSSVRSFGTEDRETQFQIAPQSQVYDYILFRGSDIKDIRVVNNGLPHPNDPAIMHVQLPNGHLMPHFPMPTINPPMGNYGNPFGAMSGLGGIGSSALAPGAGGSFLLNKPKQPSELNDAIPQELNLNALSINQQSTVGGTGAPNINTSTTTSNLPNVNAVVSSNSAAEHKDQDLLTGASRSTTPISLISRKSPSADMAVQVNQPQQQHQQQQQHHQQHNIHHQQNTGGGGGGGNRDAGHKRQNHQQRGNNRGGAGGNDMHSGGYYQRDRRDSGRIIDNQHNNTYHPQHDNRNSHYNNNNQRNSHHLNPHTQQGGSGQNNQRGWTINRGQNNNMMRNRGGRGRMQNQGFRPMGGGGSSGNPNKNNRTKNTIKFEQDFDFEQANNKFEELRSQLSKLKVGDEPKNEQINGETDKKDDSGNETGAGEHEPEDEEITVGYDKTKSFFDNISCEAAQDRSKNKKSDWRQERKLNSETFGVSSTRRGSYRGRGSYYNRNMNNYGGYNRNYRGGNNYNRNNNRNNNNRIIGVSATSEATGGGSDENNMPTKTQNNQQQQNQSSNQKSAENNSQTQVAEVAAGQ